MQAFDEKIVLLFQNLRCGPLTFLFKLFIPLEVWLLIALVVVMFFFLRTGLLQAPVISFFLARNLSFYCFDAAKDFFHRPRPFLTMPHAVPVYIVHGFSFPSGHSTLAMASAVVLGHHFPKSGRWVYTLAVLTGLSRIYLGVHYLTDVLGGFVLGALLGGLSILSEQGILALTRGVRIPKNTLMAFALLAVLIFPSLAQAADEEQNEIILLNDSSSALQDDDVKLSKTLGQLADEKEKEWTEAKNAGKTPTEPVLNENQRREQMRALNTAAGQLEAPYPLIAKGLRKMVDDIFLQGVLTGMPEGDFLKLYPQNKWRTARHDGPNDYLTYNVPLDDAFDQMVTFYFENNKLAQWKFDDRPEVVKEYLSEFSFYQPSDTIGQAIAQVLQRMPYKDFLSATRRERPMLFTEFYSEGTARFASSSEFVITSDDAPCCSEGFTIVKLGQSLGLSKTPDPIEGVVAHEIAHRVLDSIRKGNTNCNAERRANRLIVQWGFKQEFKEAAQLFGQKKGDPAGCQETPDKKGV